MAKTTAPLLSFDGSGQVAKTQVYSSWRGIPYVRRYTIPQNPRTNKQTETRDIFAMLNTAWLYAPTLLTAPWELYATGRPFLARNAFMGENIKTMRSYPAQTDLANFLASPGAKGGIPPESVVTTPSSTTATVAVALPDTPQDWTLEAGVAIVTKDQAPAAAFVGPWIAVEDTASPESIALTGLTAETDYIVSVYLRWLKANGDLAYSRSITDQFTTTA